MKNDTTQKSKTAPQEWSEPRVVRIGAVADVVRGGGSKGSLPLDGDGRKPGGQL